MGNAHFGIHNPLTLQPVDLRTIMRCDSFPGLNDSLLATG